ncbi:hypothetical protein [Novipirellula artificiosorum]|uniref:Uncharacterized protein n=1 Tax=Novipirellula artificiosorum TaxID=2528016 RepID=A0A5C6DNM8_9BACT|nr:hypothetical protein [Novipirellula artificiosorum]TWU38212.1 hypothetical protein Poly41_26880 [Novipirellula artificiosorum]
MFYVLLFASGVWTVAIGATDGPASDPQQRLGHDGIGNDVCRGDHLDVELPPPDAGLPGSGYSKRGNASGGK